MALVLSLVRLPTSLNHSKVNSQGVKSNRVSYWSILKVRRALFCLMNVIFALMFSVFFEPFLTVDLSSIGFNENYVGFYFGIFALAYTVMSFMVGPLTKRLRPSTLSFASYIIIAVGCSLFGPSSILDNPEQSNYLKSRRIYAIIGLLLLGIGTGLVSVPILVDLVASIKESRPFSQEVNDRASGLFTMC